MELNIIKNINWLKMLHISIRLTLNVIYIYNNIRMRYLYENIIFVKYCKPQNEENYFEHCLCALNM